MCILKSGEDKKVVQKMHGDLEKEAKGSFRVKHL